MQRWKNNRPNPRKDFQESAHSKSLAPCFSTLLHQVNEWLGAAAKWKSRCAHPHTAETDVDDLELARSKRNGQAKASGTFDAHRQFLRIILLHNVDVCCPAPFFILLASIQQILDPLPDFLPTFSIRQSFLDLSFRQPSVFHRAVALFARFGCPSQRVGFEDERRRRRRR